MNPSEILHLESAAFGDVLACLGPQLILILSAVQGARSDLAWYVADVETIGPSPVRERTPVPVLVGDVDALIRAVAPVEQFECGVFSGVPAAVSQPAFRSGGLWTEDEDTADIGDAVVEIRAFDTSYWIISTSDRRIAAAVEKRCHRAPVRTEGDVADPERE